MTERPQDDTEPAPPPPPPEGVLILRRPGPLGAALGLRDGDVLVAINGLPFCGTPEGLAARLGTRGRMAALTFRRAGQDRVVLASRMDLGKWDRGPKPADAPEPGGRLHPEGMENWEVLSDAQGRYDLQRLAPAPLALIPPLWLAQARLWTLLGVWGAITLVSIPAGLWVALVLQALMMLYFWRAAPALFRADRMARGMQGYAILAAATEAQVHEAVAKLDPRLCYVYAHTPPQPAEATPQAGA